MRKRLARVLLAAGLGIGLSSRASAAAITPGLDLTTATALLARGTAATTFAAIVLDADGNVLAARTPEELVKPASCNKLFTTGAALHLLGPDFHTTTTVQFIGQRVSSGTLQGHLLIRGGGDPTISGRFEVDKSDVLGPMRRLAKAIYDRGLREVRDGIVVDDRLFDDAAFHPSWPASERAEWYSAEVSALSFNDNCIDLDWSAKGLRGGDMAALKTRPVTGYVRINSDVRVSAIGRPSERSYMRGPADNIFVAEGTLQQESARVDSAAIHDGALWFGTVFRDVLVAEGIKVSGEVRHVNPATASDTAPIGEEVSMLSPPLQEWIKTINRNSQNFYADTVCKWLGVENGAHGSWARGTARIMEFVAKSPVYHAGHRMVDGSGLSHDNRTTARQLAEWMRWMDQGPRAAVWRESLPQGGTRGSLKDRFQETTETRRLAPRVFAKTGLIDRVRSLTGVIDNGPGRRPLYFSVVLNGVERGKEGIARQAMDAFVMEVVAAAERAGGSVDSKSTR